MTMYTMLLVTLAMLLLLETCVFAAQEAPTAFVHPLTDMPEPSEDVETSFYYPDHKEQKFPLGATITVLCHFSNDGLTPLNISAIMGSLNHPMDFRYHIQNYTYKPFGIVVKGGEEITLQYQFQPHPELEVAEYALAHTVFYHSDQEAFSSTFFNQTVELVEGETELDILGVVQLLFSFGSAIAVGILVWIGCSPSRSAALFGKKGAAAKVRVEDDWDDEFIVRKEGVKVKKVSKEQ